MLAWKHRRGTSEDLVVARINSTSYPGKSEALKETTDATLITAAKDPA
jgi:hypothetical protein